MLFHDIFAHHPKEREAIIDQDRSVTYGEFQDLVERWAAYFEALGVKKGDRVGLVSKNCLEFIVTYFADQGWRRHCSHQFSARAAGDCLYRQGYSDEASCRKGGAASCRTAAGAFCSVSDADYL